jgi:DNA invertase Pin-like site-specific DNA recombinase
MNSPCVAFYLRSATGNAADLEKQKKKLETEFTHRKTEFSDCTTEIYVDPYSNGHRYGDQLLRLKRDIEAGKIQAVMATQLNRVSLSSEQRDCFFKFLRKHRVRFISDKNFDTARWDGDAARREDANLPRIVLYCRVASLVVTAGDESILGQLDRLSAAILLGNPYGIRGHLKEIYREHVSGLDWSRPVMTKLKDEIEQGKFDLLVVTDLTRISRIQEEVDRFLELARGKCRVFSLCGFDSAPTRPVAVNLGLIAESRVSGGGNV